MMSALTAYQSPMAAHGDTFGAMQQTGMNSGGGLTITSAMTTQDGKSLPLLEKIITMKVDL